MAKDIAWLFDKIEQDYKVAVKKRTASDEDRFIGYYEGETNAYHKAMEYVERLEHKKSGSELG